MRLTTSPFRTPVVALLGLLSTACKDTLPVAPSEISSGVTVYEHANFGGGSAHITRDIEDLRDFKGACVHFETAVGPFGGVTTNEVRDWNDCISSIRVAPGWSATIYRNTGYGGQSLHVGAEIPNLQLVSGSCDHDGMNDCVSSIRVQQR